MAKLYSIFAFVEGDWREYNGLEYTEKEADRELRHLKRNGCCKFRKRCVRECETVQLSVRR